jgi:hypothetical protein
METVTMETRLPKTCPVCGNHNAVRIHEDLGDDGMFCICAPDTGCGTTFIMTPQGFVTEIF